VDEVKGFIRATERDVFWSGIKEVALLIAFAFVFILIRLHAPFSRYFLCIFPFRSCGTVAAIPGTHGLRLVVSLPVERIVGGQGGTFAINL